MKILVLSQTEEGSWIRGVIEDEIAKRNLSKYYNPEDGMHIENVLCFKEAEVVILTEKGEDVVEIEKIKPEIAEALHLPSRKVRVSSPFK